jgi:hypothetical protein
MKFPNESSLVKHISLKKGCLDAYNMGLVDPSIALEEQPLMRDKNGIVSFYSSGQHKRKKLKISDDAADQSAVKGGTMISYATYAFPHQDDKLSAMKSQASMKVVAHEYMSKLSPSEQMAQPDPYLCNSHQGDEYYEENMAFLVDRQSNSSGVMSEGSNVDDTIELDNLSSDKEDNHAEVITARDNLK